ncbi:SMI1/KNR4 family protein [Streptomyces asoensis]|uniref:SMI1/KNR4 family protein n=1 Tax=Streptomyces asoensis TaxID=249586 RepID=A0A6M4X0R6_9ACTN|nr:SMI1/KNR4 family protein [Streptomyces asoensis]QJT06228.1 SMI1/KNR4 family protein [Streptomyces asoensis]
MSERIDEVERVAAVWQQLTGWLKENAPTSYASLLPPAPEEEIHAVEAHLMQYVGYGLPAELVALWRLCGGVEHQYIKENEDEGDVGSGAFLPDGVLFAPAEAIRPRLPRYGERDYWGGAQVVPWLTRDEAGPEYGQYVSAAGVGHWSTMDGTVVSEPRYPSMAAYLESVHRTLTVGPADLMGSEVPGIVWGCLVWEDLECPVLDDALKHWAPIH